MDDSQPVTQIVQQQATVGDILKDHIAGIGGYEIAAKYGMDTEVVKKIIRDADEAGKFVPPTPAPENPADKLENKKPVADAKEGEDRSK